MRKGFFQHQRHRLPFRNPTERKYRRRPPPGHNRRPCGPQGNGDSIGICLSGNFMESEPDDRQLASLARLLQYLRELATIISK
ncbi:N-acetylmuramoyl-L-alanine amidase [Syntrophomonas wolfei]|uniref:N-acetylmuramoyl-L-alanine amidase n=1 Tax=Syntrophomonas wolfei TaxID=863 RepID=UPI001389FC21